MTEDRVISFGEAVREALFEAIERDPNVFLMGEGVADPSSMWGTTKGVVDRFGPDAVVEMPVAENGMVGVAIGAALAGQRPVMSLQRVEFTLYAFEQIVNNAAKMHYVSNGTHRVPLVIRAVVGRGWGQGPEHSQSLESVYGHFPGLKVLMPTYPRDAKGMITAAIEDDNPCIVIEHRWLHNATGHVPAGYLHEALDGPRVVREGDAATVVATSYMTLEAMRAADILADHGVSIEVLDLRVVRPLNIEPVLASVTKTGRLVTVDTGWAIYGVGAEIIAQVAAKAFGALERAPIRLGLPDYPTPSSRGMVPGFYPDATKVIRAVGTMAGLSPDKVETAVAAVVEQRGDLPVDVPDPFFKGPF